MLGELVQAAGKEAVVLVSLVAWAAACAGAVGGEQLLK